MRYLLLLFVCLLSFRVIGQSKATRQPVGGLAYSLVPPPEFVPATTFDGFQNERLGASIMVTELPTPAASTAASFTAQALKAKGMVLRGQERVMIGKQVVPLLAVSQNAYGTSFLKQILIWGDAQKTVLVSGTYPETNKRTEYQIQAALMTIAATSKPAVDPLAALTFVVDVKQTPFKLAKVMAGTCAYTTSGTIPATGPNLLVGNSLGRTAPTSRAQWDSFSRERLKKLPHGENARITQVKRVKVGRLAGTEIIATSTDKDGKPSLMYQMMLFDAKGAYYLIFGTTTDNFDRNEALFRQIAQTFRLKS